jgi:CelD/BcsL family acetyltransferase involved in cellulose biosynthesis
MSYSVSEDTLDNLYKYWREKRSSLVWPVVFVLPPWLGAWWQAFGSDAELNISTVRQDDSIIGIAPLRIKDNTAYFIGDIDVCDYVDFIFLKSREEEFFKVLMDYLVRKDIRHMELKHLRPDSISMQRLIPVAKSRGYAVVTAREDVNVEMDLPPDWDAYLESLNTKQRHEVRRKLRRLQEAGNLEFRFIEDAESIPGTMDMFFKMFVESRSDKAEFLTEKREAFFRLLTAKMAEAGLLKLGVLELDSKPVAQIICFDYNGCVFLYNSGYNPDYVSLSAGLLSKVLAIKASIEIGKRKFDFLKGSETYKFQLGGKEVPLYRCLIELK